jgi:hypothetical protein
MEETVKLNQAAAIIAISALALTACSGGDDDNKADDNKSAKAADAGIVSPADLTELPKLKQEKGIVADVEMENCDVDKGKVRANGTAKNTANKARDLVVAVSWAATTGGDVVAREVAELKNVAPGKAEKWSVDSSLNSADGIQCVLTATAGELK